MCTQGEYCLGLAWSVADGQRCDDRRGALRGLAVAFAKRQGDQGLSRQPSHTPLFPLPCRVGRSRFVSLAHLVHRSALLAFRGPELIRLPFYYRVYLDNRYPPLLLPFHAAEAVLVAAASFQPVEQLCNTFHDAHLMTTLRGSFGTITELQADTGSR